MRLANDRVSGKLFSEGDASDDMIQNTHQQVKAKILERMGEWAEMFSRDPDLGIMEQAYTKLKSQSTPTRNIF